MLYPLSYGDWCAPSALRRLPPVAYRMGRSAPVPFRGEVGHRIHLHQFTPLNRRLLCAYLDLNQGPADYESDALTTEL